MNRFIVIDGPDGVGKTTLAKSVVAFLTELGSKAVYTCEPTRTPLGMQIREHLKSDDLSPAALMELFVKDRQAHLRDFVEPTIREGIIVICDRYKYSTICYQHLHGLPLEALLTFNAFTAPDIVFLMELDPNVILQRMSGRGQTPDLFESESFTNLACEMFRRMPSFFPDEEFVHLDARQTTDNLKVIIANRICK